MTALLSFKLFDTAIGPCAVVWSARGIAGVQFPEADAAETRRCVIKRYPAALESEPPTNVKHAIAAMIALLGGEARDLSNIVLDLDQVSDFNRKVYAIAQAIPPGQTLTYGEVAERLGDKALARAVGQALGENPVPIIVPCHRVLAANGKSGGFSGSGGVGTKMKLLTIEKAQPGGPILFDDLPLATRG